MGWEKRGGRRYYYRKRRQGEKVRSEYVGDSLLGKICAADDEAARQNRARQQAVEREARQAEAEIDARLRQSESTIAALTAAMFLAAGFHKHRGQWRKRRHAND
jgi:hypothetical protein